MIQQTKNTATAIAILLCIFLAFCLVIFIRAVFGSIGLQDLRADVFSYSLGKLSGLIGFLFLSLLIISGDTARFFDRFFGMDKIIKFQRQFSLANVVFVLSHPIFFILSNKSMLSYLLPNFSIIPIALGTVSLYIFILVMIASKFYKRISYRAWQYIHILTYILFFFSLYHAVNLGSDFNLISIKIIYGIILIFISVGIVYRTHYKIKKRHAGKFYVEELKNETKDTFTLILRPEKSFSFRAGQFCFLRLNKDKLYARHPFTISSDPGDGKLHFTVKFKGKFTKALYNLNKGEEVIIDGPFGTFTTNDEHKDLVFIAGGVGIAPFMSIIKDKFRKNKGQNIVLLYGSKTKEDIIYKNELDAIKKDWFKKVYVINVDHSFSKEGYEMGYINKEIIEKHVKDVRGSLFYVCGPEIMKNSVNKILKEFGVARQNIIIEDFFW